MRQFMLFLYEGPRRPWGLVPLLVPLYPALVVAWAYGKPMWWVWLVGWPLLLWWMIVRFVEVGQVSAQRRRHRDWSCPACGYPFDKLTKESDPRRRPCPECGKVPLEVLAEAKGKLDRAARW